MTNGPCGASGWVRPGGRTFHNATGRERGPLAASRHWRTEFEWLEGRFWEASQALGALANDLPAGNPCPYVRPQPWTAGYSGRRGSVGFFPEQGTLR